MQSRIEAPSGDESAVWARWRAMAALVVCGGLLLLVTALGLGERLIDVDAVTASVSGAAPAQAAPSAGAQQATEPLDYFPARFVVERWAERPLPPQF